MLTLLQSNARISPPHCNVWLRCRCALHALEDDRERELALREMYRVLRPGGRMLIFDNFETSYYAEVLTKIGAQTVTLSPWSFPWLVPSRTLQAQK